jgi:DNA-binding GntR family transcriptional regulator
MRMSSASEEKVYQKLKNAIIKRFIKKGAKLVETSLAEQLKVSRTPVRIAIKRLIYEGFATYIPNRGAYVIEPSMVEIQEAFFVRSLLEKKAVALAARNITGADLNFFHDQIAQESMVFKKRDMDQYYVINDAIHLKIAELGGNQVLRHYVEEILNRTKIYLILYDPFDNMAMHPSIHEHREIVEALEKKDGKAAGRIMESHLKSAYDGMEIDQIPPDGYISL